MSAGVRRRLTRLTCSVLEWTAPPSLAPWAAAIRGEAEAIADPGEALRFTLGSAAGLLPGMLGHHLFRLLAAIGGAGAQALGSGIDMEWVKESARRPQALGIACGIGAVALGLGYMGLAGAPVHYPGINIGALLIGLGLVAALGRRTVLPGAAVLAMGLALVATALLGPEVDGARRWVAAGPIFLQPSLILLPAMIVAFARARSGFALAGIVAAAAALALQPDRAMAGSLAAALAVLALLRPERRVLAALAASVGGFAVTLARADTQGAMPYVDQILYTAFDVHALAGVAVVGGSLLLLVPAILGRLYDAERREVYSVFGMVWLAIVAAAALGNYPTPLVGYGGSAVLGYMLSLTGLPKTAQACLGVQRTVRAPEAEAPDQRLCIGLAWSR